MRGAVLALLCIFTLSNAALIEINKNGKDEDYGVMSNPSEAPEICAMKGSDSILVAHEKCNQFYKCLYGHPVAYRCPSTLLYSPDLENCDWPENVDCGNRIISDDGDDQGHGNGQNSEPDNGEGNSDPSEAPAICAKKDSEGVLVAHEKCTNFYKCSKGHPVKLSCPSGLFYNSKKEYCDWPTNVICGDRIIPEDKEDEDNSNIGNENENTTNCDPSKAPAICAEEGSDGVLVAHEKCNNFYKCSKGHPVALSCPVNLLYNTINEQCDWPENVKCDERTMPENKEDEETDSDNVSIDNNINGHSDPSKAPAICAMKGSDGVLVAHEQCAKFYKCFEGHPVGLNCPSGLLYNSKKEYCDWAFNVNCEGRIVNHNNHVLDESDNDVSNPGNCDPSEAPTICAQRDSDGVLVAHEKCNRFYTCSGGRPVPLKCPTDLLYNPKIEQCDWPYNVACGLREIPDENVDDDQEIDKETEEPEVEEEKEDYYDPSEAPAICAMENSDGLMVAHEKCNHFYQCSGGSPIALKCPGTLLYNTKDWSCDWSHNVVCGDRYIPEEDDVKVPEDEKEEEDPEQHDKEGNYDPSQAPVICAAKDSDGVLVAHEKCNKFYLCDKSKTIEFSCPKGLMFNPRKDECDWPVSVECGERVIPNEE